MIYMLRIPLPIALAAFPLDHLAEAEAHLADVAQCDADEREEVVARAYLALGRKLTPRRFAARSRAALGALRAGAGPHAVMRALSQQ